MPVPRKRSCAQCRSAKTRCSLSAPKCSRCLSRRLSCDYRDTLPRAVSSAGLEDTWQDALPAPLAQETAPSISERDIPNPLAISDVADNMLWDDLNSMLQPINADSWLENPFSNLTTSNTLQEEPVQQKSFSYLLTAPLEEPIRTFLIKLSQQLYSRDVLLLRPCLELVPPRFNDLLSPKSINVLGKSLISSYILNKFSSYTTMLATMALPPVIHKFGSAPDLSSQHLTCDFELLEPLANCKAFIPMFRSKTPGSAKFLNRILVNEVQRLHIEFHKYDERTRLAAIQSLAIYIILFAEEERNHRCLAMSVVLVLAIEDLGVSWVKQLLQRDIILNDSSWYNWIICESSRRTMILLSLLHSLLSMDIGVPKPNICVSFKDMHLPCSKELWEASTKTEWEGRYGKYLSSRKASEPLKIRDLIAAHSAENASPVDQGRADDLHDWTLGLDDFGDLVMLVVR
ncbi:hypothetical protein B0O99DRAFT_622280 [Bisporella sp. PMI_857]|nr:hypothetical protein B0O99DRAFT_622280 [Bisporella sp. PMI_857]